MVYDKAKSGDPDFDDKVPEDAHAGGKVVTAGDGREVLVTDANGPINRDGSHAGLAKEDQESGDNRPAPGGVAEESSTAQVVTEPAVSAPRRGPVKSGSK